ncbi:RodZ domain-containing protein [Fontimonas sp. SYSU GA230001]|uniref:helix-turn-helix domain-containing protein n=1 Tax=Fontimonas sp. SYSU GA230001 TaxID=3142450 RepID=UPI0032B5FED1
MSIDTPHPAGIESASPPAPAVEQRPSPGALIRAARERAHLSLEDMAAHTKLTRATLDALERDDYQALLEPVYVRGYYRKCAKVLEIDEKSLIDAYEARVEPRPPEAPSKLRLASGTELGSSNRLPVAMAVFAAVVAVVVCGFLWLARDTQESYPVLRDTPVSEVPGPTASPLPTDVPPGSDAVVQPAADAVAEAPPSRPVAAAAGTLRLRLRETSWVRVDDGAGRVLIDRILVGGTEQQFSGPPPLNVSLGNAPGVDVEYEGRVVDIRPFVRDSNTARFSLPLP